MAHHHLLPFLALILVILPSSSHADQTQALFSDDDSFIVSGHSLTNGVYTLSLKEDCGLTLYNSNGDPEVDFNTPTDDSGCELRINNKGQLVIKSADNTKENTILGKAGEEGTYALLFTDLGLSVFGPRIWTKSSSANQITSTPKKLKQATSNNFIFSSVNDIINGTANGDVFIASNHDTSAYITSSCTLLVKISENTFWETDPSTDEPTECNLYLTSRGVLLLLREDSEGRHTQWTGGDLQKLNFYLASLRTNGALDIYGFMEDIRQIPPYSGSVAEKIKMVTA